MSSELDSINSQISQAVTQRLPEIVALREEIHRNPELAWHEEQTTLRLKKFLEANGISSTIGPRQRGLIADISAQAKSDGIFALRGDIDAIPVEEETGLSFESVNRGVMHACGHDVHSSVVAGALIVLKDLIDQGSFETPLNVRGILQPAEEVAQGAAEIINTGALKNVNAILAIHVDPYRNVGRIGVRRGVQTAWCDQLTVEINGRGGHGARPHETYDPIYASATWINEIYARLPRSLDSRDPIAITICEIKGGSTVNVVPQLVTLRGTLRTLSEESRSMCFDTIQQLSKSIGELTGTTIDVKWGASVPSIENADSIIDLVEYSVAEFLGGDVIDIVEPSMGSEDFAFYSQDIPGALVRIGSTTPGAKCYPLHSGKLNIDSSTIEIGCNLMVRTAINWWRQKNSRSFPSRN